MKAQVGILPEKFQGMLLGLHGKLLGIGTAQKNDLPGHQFHSLAAACRGRQNSRDAKGRTCIDFSQKLPAEVVHIGHHLQIADRRPVIQGNETDILAVPVGAHPPLNQHLRAGGFAVEDLPHLFPDHKPVIKKCVVLDHKSTFLTQISGPFQNPRAGRPL